ncbi:MAG: chromosomal replication initiator protein DnaA, partial [Burkholderiales bacterium]|nr:chromosomal replication initiator protein DnaA [Burkholderiales bacterium]
ASKVNTNIRELEGALNTVLVNAQAKHEEVTLEIAKEALRSMSSPGVISIEGIQKVTAEFYDINLKEMFSKSRKANIVLPRSIAMYLAKELTQKSLIDIGQAFGGRDHTTVLHAVKKIGKDRTGDAELNRALHLIEQSLKNWQ